MISSPDNTEKPAALVQFEPTIFVQNLWATRVASGVDKNYLRLTPDVLGNRVFVDGYNGDLASVELASGNVLWHVQTHEKLTSGVCAFNGKLFTGTENGEVIAFSQKDGQIIWRAPASSQVLATPVSRHGVVVVESIDGALTALSAASGRQLWRFTQEVPALILHAASQPQIKGNIVVAGFANGKVMALNLQTGKPLWMVSVATPQGVTDIERMVDVDVNPVIVGNTVFVASYQGEIAAINLQTGRLIWRHHISSYTGIAADREELFITDAKSHVWAFKTSDGAVLWRQTQLNARNISGPALMGHYVLVADAQGYLHWMDQGTGKFVARQSLNGSGVFTVPVVDDSKVYVYTKDGHLYAFEMKGIFPTYQTAKLK